MQEKKWFVLERELIAGPYTPKEIIERLDRGEHREAQFWAKFKPHWLQVNDFRSEILKDSDAAKRQHQAKGERLWKVKSTDEQFGPFTYSQLLDYLKKQNELGNLKVFTEGYSDWKDVYSVYKILDDLGVNRRHHQRVPADGVLVIEHPSGVFECPIITLSEGGLGISHAYKLTIGDHFKGTILSPALPAKIHCSAEVVYSGTDAECGLRFTNISMEGKASLIDFVKRNARATPE